MNQIKRLLLVVLSLLFILCGCSTSKQEEVTIDDNEPIYKTVEELNGKRFGVVSGSIQEETIVNNVQNPIITYYETEADYLLDLANGRLDCIVVDCLNFTTIQASYPGFVALEEHPDGADAYYGFTKNERCEKIASDFDSYITKIKENGRLQEIIDTWFDYYIEKKDVSFDDLQGTNGTINFALCVSNEPIMCVGENGYRGIEADMLYEFGKEYGYNFNIDIMEFSSVLIGVSTGKYDMTNAIGYSDERAKSILYSQGYVQSYDVYVVNKVGASKINENQNTLSSLLVSLQTSFENTFIKENRYLMILDGLKVTIIIALASAFFGTVLGALLCILRRSKNTLVANISAFYIRIMQGVPIVVLLLILYYVVFAKSTLPAIYIGILAFSLDFSVYVCEILRSAINAVDKGQWEASDALGFNKIQTLSKVILPQALHTAIPVYKGQFISMVKMTSVVGYIAVVDLAKVSDIIRARTFDAFFPIIFTAIVYFIIAWLLTLLITKVEISIDPVRRKNILSDIDKNSDIQEDIKTIQNAKKDKEIVLELKHLRKEYELCTPLQDVNATIYKGDIISVIGPSGTGKSTLLRMINRLEEPSAGEVFAFGKPVPSKGKELFSIREKIGMVFQSFNLFPHLTVIENIMLGPVNLKGLSRQKAYEKGIALLRQVGLAQKAFSYPSELSGGQKQRIAIVRALAMEPEMIMFDEPTSALDPTMIGEVLRVISDVAKNGITMMIVTHEMKFARDVSSRVFYMDQGGIYEDGPSEQIFDNPQKELTRAFINHLKLFRFTITSKDFDFVGMNGALTNFGHEQFINKSTMNNMLSVIEEVLMEGVLTNDILYPVELSGEFSSNQELVFYIRYKGSKINPMNNMDEVSKRIIEARTYSIEYSYENEENCLTIHMK